MKFESLGVNCHKVTISTENEGLVEFFFSYETCVAISTLEGISGKLTQFRILPIPSRTTKKHLKLMGVYDWPGVTAGLLENHLAISKLKY